MEVGAWLMKGHEHEDEKRLDTGKIEYLPSLEVRYRTQPKKQDGQKWSGWPRSQVHVRVLNELLSAGITFLNQISKSR